MRWRRPRVGACEAYRRQIHQVGILWRVRARARHDRGPVYGLRRTRICCVSILSGSGTRPLSSLLTGVLRFVGIDCELDADPDEPSKRVKLAKDGEDSIAASSED